MTQLTLMMGTTASESSLEFSIQYLWSTGWICFKRNEFIWMWSNGRALPWFITVPTLWWSVKSSARWSSLHWWHQAGTRLFWNNRFQLVSPCCHATQYDCCMSYCWQFGFGNSSSRFSRIVDTSSSGCLYMFYSERTSCIQCISWLVSSLYFDETSDWSRPQWFGWSNLQCLWADMLNFSLNMPLRITVDCATLVAAYIFRQGLVCPSSNHFLDWLYTAGFYCRGAVGNDFSDQGFARALD